MAASNVSSKCMNDQQCEKNGIVKCDGCSSRFCSDHFNLHRRQLENQFEFLFSERDQLYYEFQQKLVEPIEALNQIDQWEERTLAQVKQTAQNARDRIRQFSIEKSSDEQLKLFSQELCQRKKNEDFFEDDIERLRRRLEQIKTESKLLSKMNISFTIIDWNTIIQMNNYKDDQSSGNLFHDTSLLDIKQQHILNEFCQKPNQKWRLIYRGTRDGFVENDFIRCCSKQGPTLTVIAANGYLFGGYTSVSWKNSKRSIWNDDSSAFLFTLINPHGIPPTKYPIDSSGQKSIRSSSNYGPTFGEFDICIHLDSNHNQKSNIGFPKNYSDTTGKGWETFTGTTNFQTSEIEVYQQV